ncbi:Z1 domain-containing protein [Labrys sp. ZIDIC5]|uniref:Z1 domain-containing protein n=1 Tax=Labrys sedimenti TaxID=3106036 RepID=UPI002ACA6650|nr:Z1 domain-containing protein [Labrys sp. ZIDIC5]MDZ5454438.1 Z1 domain-containing protein [Labrys sp. ZIDIC5]
MKSPQETALGFAQTSIEGQRGEAPITPETIAAVIDQIMMLPTALLATREVDREALRVELETRYSVWIGKATALEQNDNHLAWLTPDRKKNWRLWPRYRQFLEGSWSPLAVDGLDDATDQVISRLEAPDRPGAWDRRGLVVGHVQSGKTSNYTGLICKAADAGYKVIIVLAGLHNNLRSQTQMRLDEGFLGYETSTQNDRSATLANSIGVGLVDSDPSIRPDYITTRDEKGDFRAALGKNFGISPGGRPLLFVVKKNVSVLKSLLGWIDKILNGASVLENVPLLMIDDEADHASVDTKEQAFDEGGKPDEDHNPTKINGQIRLLLRKFQKSAYVGYTATPFANVFIHDAGETAKLGPDLFPRSFIVNLPAPSNYDGPVRLFGLDPTDDDTGVASLPLVRIVKDHAATSLPNETSGWMPPSHKNGFAPRYAGVSDIPPSLREAILSFILVCAARRVRGQVNAHNSLLVHVTRFTSVQSAVRSQIEVELDQIRRRLRFGDAGGEGIRNQLRRLWDDDFVPTSAAFLAIHPDRQAAEVTWAELDREFANVVERITVRTINGNAGDILDYEIHKGTGLNVIAVGGDKLARGLTLEGLSVSYFLRASKMYDTLMQMGRWFGFRPGYLDLCRLYMTAELREWFAHITEAAEELRHEFEHMRAINGTPKDYGLKVRSHPVMMVTSKVKMRHASEVDINFQGAIQETIVFDRDPDVIRANFEATEQLLTRLGPPSERGPRRPRNGGGAHVWEDARLWSKIDGIEIVKFLRNYRTHEKATSVHAKMMAEFVEHQLNREELTEWTIALLAGDGPDMMEVGGENQKLVRRKENIRFIDAAEQRADGRYLIRRLLAPRDEAIDFDAGSYDEALNQTRKDWNPDSGRSRRTTPPDTPSGLAIRSIRGRSPQHGLLLLYPLAPREAEIDVKYPIIGFGISFPESRDAKPVKYTVNNVFWEQEYGVDA